MAGPGAVATGAVALLKGAPPVIKYVLDMLDKVGVPEMIKQSFLEAMTESRTITITLKNESSRDLKDCEWHPHHGQQVGKVCDFIKSKSNATIKFAKEKNCFFGVSGYIEFTYHEEMKCTSIRKPWKIKKEKITYPVKKRVIISFSVPRRRRINKLWVALLDEGTIKQQDIPHETDMYVYLKKERNQEKMTKFSASGVKGCCRNPKVCDSKIHVYCEISGDEHATLDIIVSDPTIFSEPP